ncbi:MAG: hypothetical protein U0269_00860 [Polyangiales bacterium]
MTLSLLRAPTKSSLALFAAGLALALSATARADDRCSGGLEWDGHQCAIVVRGEPQGPQVFTMSGRSAHDWTAPSHAPRDQRAAIVNATRRRPF